VNSEALENVRGAVTADATMRVAGAGASGGGGAGGGADGMKRVAVDIVEGPPPDVGGGGGGGASGISIGAGADGALGATPGVDS